MIPLMVPGDLNQAKALDYMKAALETESIGKAEALRMKKKLEADEESAGDRIWKFN